MSKRYVIFADYFQFYLWDAQENAGAPEEFTEADNVRRIKASPHVVVIHPARNMSVPVFLNLAPAAPPLNLSEWDHFAEASLDVPSGRLEIHECTGGSIDVVDVAPGSWRIRLACVGLDTLSPDGLDGDDQYHLTLWPEAAAPVRVLKQHEALCLDLPASANSR